MPVRANSLTGAAGEHYVAYELSRMGCPVGLTRGGSPSVDLMAGNPERGSAVSIQVKTSEDAYRHRKRDNTDWWCWRFAPKGTLSQGDSLFYAFVSLHNQEHKPLPVVFIMPAREVVACFATGEWARGWFGIVGPDCEKWHEAWQLIKEKLKL